MNALLKGAERYIQMLSKGDGEIIAMFKEGSRHFVPCAGFGVALAAIPFMFPDLHRVAAAILFDTGSIIAFVCFTLSFGDVRGSR